MPVQLSDAVAKLISDLLVMSADLFVNRGCNEFEIDDTPENREIAEAVMPQEDGFDRVEVRRGKIMIIDYIAMRHYAERLRSDGLG